MESLNDAFDVLAKLIGTDVEKEIILNKIEEFLKLYPGSQCYYGTINLTLLGAAIRVNSWKLVNILINDFGEHNENTCYHDTWTPFHICDEYGHREYMDAKEYAKYTYRNLCDGNVSKIQLKITSALIVCKLLSGNSQNEIEEDIKRLTAEIEKIKKNGK